jgi:hypothetical protein
MVAPVLRQAELRDGRAFNALIQPLMAGAAHEGGGLHEGRDPRRKSLVRVAAGAARHFAKTSTM